MPEGPECRTVADQLQQTLEGRDIVRMSIEGGRFRKTAPDGWNEFKRALGFGPLQVKEVNCKGKFIYMRLEDDWSIWNTLGMTGTWSNIADKHSAICMQHQMHNSESRITRKLFFTDQRRFGTLKFVKDEAALQKKLDSLGIDFLQEEPAAEDFYKLIHKKPLQQIAQVLMDQSRCAGVGNYIKSDALYLSGISPKRLAGSLTPPEMDKLLEAIRDVMTTRYNSGGSTIQNYRDVNGTESSY